jgi:VWFA-related protein
MAPARHLTGNPLAGSRAFLTMLPACTRILATALAAGIALAQPGVVIRSTTRLVQVHVVALDNSGSPVSGLRKEDFRIFDERKERPLVSFTVEGAEPIAPLAAVLDKQLDEQGDAGNGYSAILLDWLNGGLADRLRGDDAVRKVLKTFPPRQQVALYVLGMEPPNSAHPLRLVSGVEDPMILPRPDMTDAPGKFDARSGSGSRMASVEEQLFDWRSRILDTVRALADLAGDMAHIPGRKSLIWLTTGISHDH